MRSMLAIALCTTWATLPARETVIRPFQASPAASVAQDLGICSVKIDYHRPAVGGLQLQAQCAK